MRDTNKRETVIKTLQFHIEKTPRPTLLLSESVGRFFFAYQAKNFYEYSFQMSAQADISFAKMILQ